VAFDRTSRVVRCPRCALERTPPDVCPSCGAVDFKFVGAGSERLEEQLGKMFPDSKVVRMDKDVIGDVDLEQPHVDTDIYVTTWIGTKPSLRPQVSFVGVLDADAVIRRAGFRAAENAYHALSEMSEWAGPASEGGRLVIQTEEPSHHSIQAVVRADHDYFVEREMELRKELSYPPFSELLKATAVGAGARSLIDEVSKRAEAGGGRVLGPIPIAAPQGRGEAGEQILVKCDDAGVVSAGLRDLVAAGAKDARLSVDVDPR
jgi:primosomal protein N' (replication factor Y)